MSINDMPTPVSGNSYPVFRKWRAVPSTRSKGFMTVHAVPNGIADASEQEIPYIISLMPGPTGSSYIVATDKHGKSFNLRID